MTERAASGADDVALLRAAWAARVAADGALEPAASGLFEEQGAVLDAVVAAVAVRADDDVRAESPPTGSAAGPAALATGRAAHARRVDLPGLQRLFGHLHDELSGQLMRRSENADGSLHGREAESIAQRVRASMEWPLAEATRGWIDAAGRKLRHDVKTPLQATSLNLELLTLESAERGLDTAALDTIQSSLDQVVELLARAEPASG